MTRPIPVEVVRPDRKGSWHAAQMVSRVIVLFLQVYVLMLVIPAIADWAPGFWTTFALVIAVRTVMPSPNGPLDLWSWAAGDKSRK